ncbi:hypothetical protein NW759_016271 [Fusarium solani]|nr:hypothetical protein NW759_016271 [Fusarium solani]
MRRELPQPHLKRMYLPMALLSQAPSLLMAPDKLHYSILVWMDSAGRYRLLMLRPGASGTPPPSEVTLELSGSPVPRAQQTTDTRSLEEKYPTYFVKPLRAALHEIQQSGVARLRIPGLPMHELTDTPEHVNEGNEAQDTRVADGARDDFGVKQPTEEQDIIWRDPERNTLDAIYVPLELYSLNVSKAAKSQFLRHSFFEWAWAFWIETPEIKERLGEMGLGTWEMNRVIELVKPKLTRATFMKAFGSIAKFISYQETFGDKDCLAWFYL